MVAIRQGEAVEVDDPASAGSGAAAWGASPDEFCRAMYPKLVGALRLYLGDVEVARELAQEALVRVVERWPAVTVMRHPEAWTYRVAFNLARSALRRRMAERRAHVRHGARPDGHVVADAAEALAVRQAVAILPPRQREAIVLRFFGDLTVDQIAEAMGCRPGTVKAHLHQALTALRAAGLTDPSPHPGDTPVAAAHTTTEASTWTISGTS